MQEFFRRGEEIAKKQEEEETNNTSTENLIQGISLGDASATTYCIEYF